MITPITINIEVKNKAEAHQVKKAIETMNAHFKGRGIIKMEQLFLQDAFIRNLVKININKR